MLKPEQLLAKVTERLDLPAETLGRETQVQLSGDRQVMVAGHRGIRIYTPERIEVRTGRLRVCVDGSGLRVALLTREHLVIRGTVRAVTLEARE